MSAFYNEIDPFAAAWLRELIKGGHIADGTVDERDIRDLRPSDLDGFAQVHFFAGIGGWSYALRLAGWPDDRPVWTGSCPCQPFSAAGQGGGFFDERHLWPAFFHLISECRPATIFGEQVASKDGLAWLDLVHADLEGAGYASGAADLCAAGVGAPHIRQRLWFVAQRGREGRQQIGSDLGRRGERGGTQGLDERSVHGGTIVLADADEHGCSSLSERRFHDAAHHSESCGSLRKLADAHNLYAQGIKRSGADTEGRQEPAERSAGPRGAWDDVTWLPCRDGKARPTQPGLFPLAHGIPNRVGTLRGAGNAINPIAGAEFIRAADGPVDLGVFG